MKTASVKHIGRVVVKTGLAGAACAALSACYVQPAPAPVAYAAPAPAYYAPAYAPGYYAAPAYPAYGYYGGPSVAIGIGGGGWRGGRRW